MGSTSHSLVLGFAANLSADSFRPFAHSLRATGYRGRFGLITAKCSPDQRAQLAALADLHWDVDDQFTAVASTFELRALKWLRATRGARRFYPTAFQVLARGGRERMAQARWEQLEYELEGLQSLRYRLYYEFLQRIAPDADIVLLSDLRDVVFQTDPFAEPVTGLELYLEDPSSTLGTDPFNSRWVRNLRGPNELRRLAAENTSCSGTTVGDRPAILDYLARMSQAILWRRRPLGNHDQGVHNGLLRRGSLPNARVVANGRGRVLTMGLLPRVNVSPEGVVLNDDGTVPAVLHQYDRHTALAPVLLDRLAARHGVQ